MTLIACKRLKCMYNAKERCKCDAIGMETYGCDTYMETPDVLKKHENEQTLAADEYKYCPHCGTQDFNSHYAGCPRKREPEDDECISVGEFARQTGADVTALEK